MNQRKHLSRRSFLVATASVTASGLMAACAGQATPPPPAKAAATTAPAAAPATAAPAAAATKAPAATAAPAAKKLSGKITIMVAQSTFQLQNPASRVPEAQIMLDLFDEYQKNVQPGVKIELEENVAPQGQAFIELPRMRAQAGTITDLVNFQPVPSLMQPELFYQVPKDILDKPNPYSPNKRWMDDFPYDGVLFSSFVGAEPGTYWGLGMTRLGGSSIVVWAYNRDLWKKAGISDGSPTNPASVPKTWAEMIEMCKKLKSIGVVPFDVSNHISGGCCAVWFHGWIYSNLIEGKHKEIEQAAATFFGDKLRGQLNLKQAVYLLKTGKWRMDNEYSAAFFQVLKEFSDYWQPGYLAQTTENLFLQQKAGMILTGVTGLPNMVKTIKDQFKIGTFTPGGITKDTWAGATGAPMRAIGSNGQAGTFSTGGSIYMIPQQTVKAGKLDLVLDFLQWLTAPAQLEKYGERMIPRSAKQGRPQPKPTLETWSRRSCSAATTSRPICATVCPTALKSGGTSRVSVTKLATARLSRLSSPDSSRRPKTPPRSCRKSRWPVSSAPSPRMQQPGRPTPGNR